MLIVLQNLDTARYLVVRVLQIYVIVQPFQSECALGTWTLTPRIILAAQTLLRILGTEVNTPRKNDQIGEG